MPADDVLAGHRVFLRPPRLSDAEALFTGVTSDPRVTEYLSWRPHRDVDETRRVITELFNVGDDHTWVIVTAHTDEVIGQFGYRRPARPTESHAVEIGYCLARRWWGQGIMSDAMRLMLDRFEKDNALYRVSAACHVDNVRSARLLHRSGLALEGRLARYIVFPNLSAEPQDSLLYARAVR